MVLFIWTPLVQEEQSRVEQTPVVPLSRLSVRPLSTSSQYVFTNLAQRREVRTWQGCEVNVTNRIQNLGLPPRPCLVPASGPRLLLSKQQTYFGAQEAQQHLTIFHLSLLLIRAVLLT